MHPRSLFDSARRPSALRSAWLSLPVTCFYLLLAGAIVWALPERAWQVKTQALVAMSLFGVWRYSWQALHVIRHWRYRRRVFPALRAKAMGLDEKYPKRLYVMVPSYREESSVSELVFAALIREAQTIPSSVRIYASVASDDEVEFISKVINSTPGGENVDVVFMHQSEGKRVAMGYALRAIARDFNDPFMWHTDASNDVVVFMDGDTLVEPGMFLKTLPYFRANGKLGALTTDNVGVSPNATGVFSDWYSVKFAQRHHIFHSHALSNRVLTVTGRFSLYRASVVVNEEFIRFLEADYLDHWLFGRFRFLMGDDKSTWYYLLKEGWDMLYVPDAMAVALETRQTNFFRTSLSLMFRWYGNMLRNNWRAVRLGPKPMGFFVWWCILDQRFSSFTPLVGPVSILLLSALDSWYYLAFYMSWVILTRLGMLWIYVLEGMRMRVLHIPLLLYNQWIGAAIKIYSTYSLAIQTWQKSEDEERSVAVTGGLGLIRNGVRMGLVSFNIMALVVVCGIVSGAFVLPGIAEYKNYTSELTRGDERPVIRASGARGACEEVAVSQLDGSTTINRIIASVDTGQCREIVLPEGRIILDAPIVINRDNIRIRGAGAGKTVLVSRMKRERGAAVILVGGHKGPVVGHMDGAANKGDVVLSVAEWPKDSQYVWLGAPNDEGFLDTIGDAVWRKHKPWVRQYLGEVVGVGDGYIVLKKGVAMAFPAGTEIRAARVVSGVAVSDLSIKQEVPGMRIDAVRGVYDNVAPEYAVDGLRFDWAARSTAERVEIVGAGRHPLVFENSRDIVVRDVRIDGGWNKGKNGNGYVRFARSFDCQLEDALVKNIRHLTFQWSAARNVVRDSRLYVDVNFHGGFSQNNLVENCTITPPSTHPWGEVTRLPAKGARWAPPDGPENRVVPEP